MVTFVMEEVGSVEPLVGVAQVWANTDGRAARLRATVLKVEESISRDDGNLAEVGDQRSYLCQRVRLLIPLLRIRRDADIRPLPFAIPWLQSARLMVVDAMS